MFQLSDAEQRILLGIARAAVEQHLARRTAPIPEIPAGNLREPRGVFVSLHRGEALRGCIGNIHPATPLYRTTAECAVSASVADPRFMPLQLEEVPLVHFEISVLSPLERVYDLERIRVGDDGLFVAHRNARGLLLPQVATAYGWSRERFLAETCRKAGLPAEAWKKGAQVFRFSAQVFGEPRDAREAVS